MKTIPLLTFMLCTQLLFAQSFTEVMGTPFEGVGSSSIAFADVDGDNDQDVLITGYCCNSTSSSNAISRLYTNDGMGNFTEMMGTPFEGVGSSSIAFADVDGDNDEDVLITGYDSSGGAGSAISKLYTNDGMGNFTEMMGTPFEGVGSSSIAFADVDGDNDQDVLITGYDSSGGAGSAISKLYTNDGDGNFTEVMGPLFEGVGSSSIAFADVDGDNDQDVLITGWRGGGHISKLYTNDGAGNFTEVMGTLFEGVEGGSIAFADVDGDNDQDVLITGQNGPGPPISKLYTNDGGGNFTEVMGTPFEGVQSSSIAFADVDGDNDQDVLITGQGSVWMGSGSVISKLYTNDGDGNFTEVMGPSFEGVRSSSIAFADVDGDNNQDVLITGDSSGITISKLYINDGIVSSNDDLIIELGPDFMIYPNPSKAESINVYLKSSLNVVIQLKVYDLKGHLIIQQKEFAAIEHQAFSIDIASLSPGNYFIQLDDGKRKGVAKFMVQ